MGEQQQGGNLGREAKAHAGKAARGTTKVQISFQILGLQRAELKQRRLLYFHFTQARPAVPLWPGRVERKK